MSDSGNIYEEDVSIVRPYDERSTLNENLEDIIQLEHINKATGAAASIELDLENKGPLYSYANSVRSGAVSALMEILSTDPRDSVQIAILQQRALKFREISEHIHGILDDARQADKFIEEEYGE